MTDEQVTYWITNGGLLGWFFVIRGIVLTIRWHFRNTPYCIAIKRAVRIWWVINKIRIKIRHGKLLYSGFGVIEVIDLKTGKVEHGKFWID